MKTGMGPGSSGSLGSGNLRPTVTSPNNWTFYTWNSVNGVGAGYVTIDSNLPFTDEITVIITD
jgi:hypothetical protein